MEITEKVFLHINGARVQLHLAKNPIGFQQKVSHGTQRSESERYYHSDQ